MADLNSLEWLNLNASLPDAVREYERYWIKRALEPCLENKSGTKGVIVHAARQLGITWQSLSYILRHRYPDLIPPNAKAERSDKGTHR